MSIDNNIFRRQFLLRCEEQWIDVDIGENSIFKVQIYFIKFEFAPSQRSTRESVDFMCMTIYSTGMFFYDALVEGYILQPMSRKNMPVEHNMPVEN